MRNIVITLFLGAATLFGCENAQQPIASASEPSNPLLGEWEFVSSRAVLPDTIMYNENRDDRIGLYFFSDSHWGFIASTPDKEYLRSGWGTYTIDGNKYTEYVQFQEASELIGSSIEFEFEIVGDTLKKFGYLPVWDEVEPYAGGKNEVLWEEVRVKAGK